MNKARVVVSVVIILLLVGAYFVLTNIQGGEVNDGVYASSPEVQSGTEKTFTWSEYDNKELGISFSYPEELLKEIFRVQTGAISGRIFYGSLSLPSGGTLQIRAVTNDFSAERGWNWSETLGFVRVGDEYFLKDLKGNQIEVFPKEFWPISNTSDTALVLLKNDFPQGYAMEFYIPDALVIVNNIGHTQFLGIGFELNGTSVTPDDIALLRRILGSLELK